MVGIVVVSHSRALADAAVALAVEMLTSPDVAVEVAAGLDETTFGTDAVAIADALVAADEASGGDGVVVLMDLGSAVLSAELALELLPDPALAERVLLCPAPLVEGLVAAVVTASSGASREQIAAEASNALAAKQSQLTAPPPPSALPPPTGGGPVVRFTVKDEHGLHARPAARLVQLVQGFDASVELRNATTGSEWVPAASLSRVATLAALRGHEVEARATGPEASEALSSLGSVAGAVPPPPPPPPPPSSSGPFAASPGIAIGPVRQAGSTSRALEAVERAAAASPDAENADLAAALTQVRVDITQVRDRVARESGADDAGIFDAHLALLADPELASGARDRIAEGWTASSAFAAAALVAAQALESLPDEYLRARGADIRAVANQVLTALQSTAPAPPTTPSATGGAGVLVAAELTPAEAAVLDPGVVLGVVLAYGSPTAHAAILVRGRGIPAVVGAGPAVLDLADGTTVIVDGTEGTLLVDPSADELSRSRTSATEQADRRGTATARTREPALTRDGTRILVGANVGSPADAAAAATAGADIVGLVRTEFLFLGRDRAPDVDEQEDAYRALADAAPGIRLTLRTLDVGGDKPLPYVPMAAEANPFLGVRGLRLALARPELLADQLLAMVRVAHDAPVGIMFPMVTTVAELRAARLALDAAVRRDGRPRPAGLEVGIMVEVPAAALKAAAFAPLVDFFSIGTNDLTQYTLAAERGNDALAGLADPLDPAVLKLIDATCRAAGDRTVAVCGELAADERATALLVGLGVSELSMSPAGIPAVKQAVRALSDAEAKHRATESLGQPSAEAVRSS